MLAPAPENAAILTANVPEYGPYPLDLPASVPSPPAIPALAGPKYAVIVEPGVSFHGLTIHGDGLHDDTAALQAALRLGDLVVEPGVYAIAGNVAIPTSRSIYCRSGAVFLDTQSKSTRMFEIGYSPSSSGSNTIAGCHFRGTDYNPSDPGGYSNYKGGAYGYSELFEITSGSGVHVNDVLVAGNTFSDAQGDSLITYSGCGVKHNGFVCNHGLPGTEGPSNIFVVKNIFRHCAQPGFHANGGQKLVIAHNTFIDCNNNPEADAPVLQVIQSWWYDNRTIAKFGSYNPLDGQIYGPTHDCDGDDLIPQDNRQCYSFNNYIEGIASNGRPAELRQPAGSKCVGHPGHYFNESLTDGAVINRNC